MLARRDLRVIILCFLTLAPFAIAQSTAPTSKGPVSLGILVDTSALGKDGADPVRGVMRNFVRSLRPPDEYALFTVTENFRVAQEFTKDPDLADAPVRLLRPGSGGPLYDAIVSAVQYVDSEASNKRKALLIISSGEDKGGTAGLGDTLLAAQKAEVQVFVITAPGGSGQWNLQQLAERTSGAAYTPRQADLNKVSRIAAREVIGPPLTVSHPKPPAPPKPLARYGELVVRDLKVQTNNDTSDFQPGDGVALQKQLVAALSETQVFPKITVATENSTATAALAGKVELVGTIVEFRGGNYFKRSTVGLLGSGAAKLKIDFVLRDAATGETVLSLPESCSGASGLLRRSNEKNQNQATRRLIENLMKDLQRNRQPAE